MKRVIVALACVVLLFGCGPYRMRFQMQSRLQEAQPPVKVGHTHGIGPFIVGGGWLLFLFSQMSPALVDWTGTMQVAEKCPNGIAEVYHEHTVGQWAFSSFISWVGVVNWAHRSDVVWRCAASPTADSGVQTPPGLAEATR